MQWIVYPPIKATESLGDARAPKEMMSVLLVNKRQDYSGKAERMQAPLEAA